MKLIQTTSLSALLATSALAFNAEKLPGSPARIVGGYEVQPAFKYNWIASIHRRGRHYCGGSLYNGNTLITAAHCTTGSDSDFEILIHRHDLSKTDAAESGLRYKVIKRTKHPQYNSDEYLNDVAIWKLDTTNTDPTDIQLDDGSVGNNNSTLFLTSGWGTTNSGAAVSKVLLEVKVPNFDPATCVKNYAAKGSKVTIENQICAGYPEGGKDSCQGDSGGPLFVIKNDKVTLAGIVSWGIGCASKNLPGIYSRVSNLKAWIQANLN